MKGKKERKIPIPFSNDNICGIFCSLFAPISAFSMSGNTDFTPSVTQYYARLSFLLFNGHICDCRGSELITT